MKRFYIYDNGIKQEVYILTSPSLTETKDTTNDSFSCVLKANSNSEPYKPKTKFEVYEDDTWLYTFILISDSVAIGSTYPLLYVHTLQLVQDRRYLESHILRNTIFNQIRENPKCLCSYFSEYPYAYNDDPDKWFWNDDREVYTESLIIGRKVSDAKQVIVKYSFYKGDSTEEHNITELTELPTELANSKLNLVITSPSGNTMQVNNTYIGLTIGYETNQNKLNALLDFFKTNGKGTYTLAFSGDTVDSQYSYRSGYQIKFAQDLNDDISYIIAHIEIEVVSYDTIYDVLDTLIKQQALDTSNHTEDKLFSLPTSGELYELLTTTKAPDILSFTQCSMFQALEDIFRMFDATFKLTQDNVLDIEYFNDRKGEITPKLTGLTKASREEYFNNGYVNYYQQAQITKNFPNNTYAPIRSSALGVPNKTDYDFIVDTPIEFVNKLSLGKTLTCGCTPFGSFSVGGFTLPKGIDLSYYLVEQSIWTTLDTSATAPTYATQRQQTNTIYYSKGGKEIRVSDYYSSQLGLQYKVMPKVVNSAVCRFIGLKQLTYIDTDFDDNTPYSDYYFNCEYITQIDGRLKIESLDDKYKGEMLVNQSNGLVDLNKLGLNILGLALKNGEPTLNANVRLDKWDNRIEKGQIYIENNEIWVVNVITYTILNDGYIQANIEFVKNFNGLASRVQLDRQKRLSNISSELTLKSEDNYCEYVYLSSTNPSTTDEVVHMNKNVVYDLEFLTFGFATSYRIDFATISTYYDNEQVIAENIYMPLIKYPSANVLCFEMTFDSPISAGNQLDWNKSGWWNTEYYFSSVVKYTDDEGWADFITFSFNKSTDETFTKDFPKLLSTQFEQQGRIVELKYYKKPNEILALNYELVHLPLPSKINTDFIGNKLLTENGFIKGKTNHTFYFVYSTSETYDVMDLKGKGTPIATTISKVSVINKAGLRFTHSEITDKIKSWAIVDENNDIYFASNDTTSLTSTYATIYFITRHTRL